MFDNIGGKIKVVAQLATWLGIIASVVSGIVFIASLESPMGIFVMIGGSLISWLSSLTLYGFGQLIEHTEHIANNIASNQIPKQDNMSVSPEGINTCDCCGKTNINTFECNITLKDGTHRTGYLCQDCLTKCNSANSQS